MEKALTNLLINIYFALMDAADILMREIVNRMRFVEGAEMKHELKHSHRLMIEAGEAFSKRYENYLEQVKIRCLKNGNGDYDVSRRDANEMLRFLITFEDRCDTPAKSARLMEWLHYLPENVAPDDYVNKFHLR